MSSDRVSEGDGKRIWINSLNRRMLRSGELKQLIDRQGISGILTNNNRFVQSMARDEEYLGDVRTLVPSGMGVEEICERLALQDIKKAADLLLPTFKRTMGLDGFVGLDLIPDHAFDAEALIEEGDRLWEKVGLPNVMIQIPATIEALPAILDLIQRGISINAMLVCSLARYKEVTEAYFNGLTARIADGLPISDVTMAVTFSTYHQFDKILNQSRLGDVMAPLWNTLVATAWSAREVHRDYFQGSRFLTLKKKGIRPQLLMWARETNRGSDGWDYVEDLTSLSGESLLRGCTFESQSLQDQTASMAAAQGEAEYILDALQEQIIKMKMIEFDQAKKSLEEVCSDLSSKEAFGSGKSL